jgi:hypothetical protein
MGFGQLKKGDLLLNSATGGLHLNNSLSFFHEKSLTYATSWSAGLMLDDHWAVGLGVSVQKSEFFLFELGMFEIIGVHRYTFDPFFRYYISLSGAFQPFIYATTSMVYNDMERVEPFFTSGQDEFRVKALGGLGFDFFFAPNLAVEGVLSTRIFQNKGDFSTQLNEEVLAFQLGIKSFLSQKIAEDFDLESRYLSTGNYIVRGGGNLSFVNTDTAGLSYVAALSPSIIAFVTDRLAVTSGIGLERRKFEFTNDNTISLSAGAAYYLKMANGLYFTPSITFALTKNTNRQVPFFSVPPIEPAITLKEITWRNEKEIGAGFRYFSNGPFIWSWGYSFDHQRIRKDNFDERYKTHRVYAGLEYFFAKNLSLTATLAWMKTKGKFQFPTPEKFNPSSNSFHFGLNYFLFSQP